MPLIKQRPSLNNKVVKTMTLEELVKLHPLADEDYLKSEHDRITGVTEKVLRKVSEGYLKAHPELEGNVKVGDMYPM